MFNYCLPIISEGFRSSLKGTLIFIHFVDNNQFYLITISHMLRSIPKSIFLAEAPNVQGSYYYGKLAIACDDHNASDKARNAWLI